jgi:hypothetical protein
MNLVERTAALVPMLRQQAATAEQERRVPLVTLEALDQAGVFRMMAPKRFGGDEADFETQARVLAEIARACPSTSWVATIYSAMAWAASAFPDQAQDEVFAGEVPRIAGVFSPTGTARRWDGGFVNEAGRSTGCHGAEWTVVVALAAPDGGRSHTAPSSKPRADDPRRLASGMAGRVATPSWPRACSSPAIVLPLPNMVEGRYQDPQRRQPVLNYPLAQVRWSMPMPAHHRPRPLEGFFDRLPGRGIMHDMRTNPPHQ